MNASSQRAHQKNNKSDPLISRLAGQTSYEKRKVHPAPSSSSCRLLLMDILSVYAFHIECAFIHRACLSLCLCGADGHDPSVGPQRSGDRTPAPFPPFARTCSTAANRLLINPPVPLLISNRPPGALTRSVRSSHRTVFRETALM